MQVYYLDAEIFPNYSCFTFIPMTTSQDSIDEFIDLDINLLNEGLTREEYETDEELWKCIYDDIEPLIFEFGFGVNMQKELDMFISSNYHLIIGFNNDNYDNTLLDLVLVREINNVTVEPTHLYAWSKQIIEVQNTKFGGVGHPRYAFKELKKFASPYLSMDVQKLNYLDKNFISLKQTSIALKWYKVQEYDLPYMSKEQYDEFTKQSVNYYTDKSLATFYKNYLKKQWYDRQIRTEDVPGIQLYNINDVLITRQIHIVSADEIVIRQFATDHYGIDLKKTLNASRSKLADILIMHFYSELTGIPAYKFKNIYTPRDQVAVKECIFEHVEFTGKIPIVCREVFQRTKGAKKEYDLLINIKTLKDFLVLLKNKVIKTSSDLEYVLTINNTDYTFASGGLHSKDRPGFFISNDKYTYTDGDGTSYYPRMVIDHDVKPAHLLPAFKVVATNIVTERTDAKALKDVDPAMKNKADVLKIVINSGIFGE